MSDPNRADSDYVQERTELRNHVARSLEQKSRRRSSTTPSPSFRSPAWKQRRHDAHDRLAGLILQLLASAAREGELDPRSDLVADLRQAAEETPG